VITAPPLSESTTLAESAWQLNAVLSAGLTVGGVAIALVSLWLAWRWSRATEDSLRRLERVSDMLTKSVDAMSGQVHRLDELREMITYTAECRNPRDLVLALLMHEGAPKFGDICEAGRGRFNQVDLRDAVHLLRTDGMVTFTGALAPSTTLSQR
jgi:hypothetical protein